MSDLLPPNWLDWDLQALAQLAPVQWLNWPLMDQLQLKVGIKREDLLHAQLGGNKLYKLHGHLRSAVAQGHQQVLSFGGAWSNHIYALAAAGQMLGMRTTGVIRGEAPPVPSAMLQDVTAMGMQLHFISRSDYNRKHEPEFLHELRQHLGLFYAIPEGGGDGLGAEGCRALGNGLTTIRPHEPYDVVCCAVGTGGTLAGLAAGLPLSVNICGFSVLKGADQLREDVADRLLELGGPHASWQLETEYHCGGYARCPDRLAQFMQEFELQTGVRLDPVYTGKMMWGIAHKAIAGEWPAHTRILALHSGGLQGRRGFPGIADLSRKAPNGW